MRQPLRTAAIPAATLAAMALLSAGCLKVPQYQRPTAPAPQSFKEEPPQGWKEAQPNAGVLRGKWWEIFGDPALNALEERVSISNQNVLEVEAQFRQAKAAVRVARTALFPLGTGSASVTGSEASSRINGQSAHPLGTTDVGASGSYTYDVWGSIHRGIAASANTAQSFAALLENARPNTAKHVILGLLLKDNRINSGPVQQLTQQETGRARPYDDDLCSHVTRFS